MQVTFWLKIMGYADVQHLIYRCSQAGLINPKQIRSSIFAIAQMIRNTVDTVKREDIDILLLTVGDLMDLPTPDEAMLVTIGISEQLMAIDRHLMRWFLDVVMRDADPDLRIEMRLALQTG